MGKKRGFANAADRVAEMEALLDDVNRSMDELDAALKGYCEVQKKIKKLEEYYTCGLWLKDFETDEAGGLPAGLKRGVLSEDAIGDVLDRNGELAEALRDTAEALRKERGGTEDR